MATRIRRPIVAGAFYPRDAGSLQRLADELLGDRSAGGAPLVGPVGLVSPHAGYPYSGRTAAAGFRSVAEIGTPSTVVVLGANHTGLGPAVALDDHDAWETPLGALRVDREAIDRLADGGLAVDEAAFAREHSIEVQLPFIQRVWPGSVTIVPICVQSSAFEALIPAVDGIAALVEDRSALLLASSDFTHYEPGEIAKRLDRGALDRILARNPAGFLEQVRAEGLTICGAGAIAILMAVSDRLGLDQTELIHYTTSGEVTGDQDSVVGYASVLFSGGSND